MKTLKVKLQATSTDHWQYECFVDAPDDADPDDFIQLLHEAVAGEEFVEERLFDGDWQADGGLWKEAEEGIEEDLPHWQYISAEEGIVEQIS